MPEGATFTVEYYPSPDTDHFVYVVPQDGGSCVDRAGLNGNPGAQLRLFPSSSPTRGALFNQDGTKIQYVAASGKWCLSNVNGRPVEGGMAFAIAVGGDRASGSQASTAAVSSAPQGTLVLAPATLTPQLAPLTVIVREQWAVPPIPPWPDGRPHNLAPGNCLALAAKYTNPAILSTDTVIVAGQTADYGKALTWTAAVENGAIEIFVCTNLTVMRQTVTLGMQAVAVDLTGKKVNILVLR